MQDMLNEVLSEIYVVYSLDMEKKDTAIYPDDPKVIETLVVGYHEAELIAAYLRGKDPSRLYGYENWEVYQSARQYMDFIEEMEM